MSFKSFYEKFICLNLKDYPNLGSDFEINKFLFIVLVGIIVSIVVISYKRSVMNLTITKLLRHEAQDEQSAKTLSEMGIDLWRVKNELQSGGQIKSIVSRVGEINMTYDEYMALKNKKSEIGSSEAAEGATRIAENAEVADSSEAISTVAAESQKRIDVSDLLNEKIDFSKEKFYIKKSNSHKAKEFTSKSNSILLNALLYCVLTIAVFMCLILVMPEILTLLNNLLAK